MNPETFKGFLSEKLQKQELNDFKGTRLEFHIPIQEQLLNDIIQTIISSSEGMKDFNSLFFSELDESEFLIDIDHKKINKTLRCEIRELDYNDNSEPILQILFLEGFRFYEKIALKSVLSLRTGWNWFKSQWHDGNTSGEKAGQTFKISSSRLTLNLSQILKQQNLDYLIPLISWNTISTSDGKLVIDFSIKI